MKNDDKGYLCRKLFDCGRQRLHVGDEAVRINIFDVALGVIALALGVVILIGFESLGDDAVRVLLRPHAMITEAFYGSALLYQHGVGYVAPGGGFIIGPACMGVRFIVMLFCMTVCSFTARCHGLRKIIFFALSFAGSVVAGVAASCIRIVGSVSAVASGRFAALHAGTGIAVYLAVLVAVYILIDRLTGSNLSHPTTPPSTRVDRQAYGRRT